MADRVGQQLGNYRLIRLVGRGGFAEVYLGQHVRLNMQTAIKVLQAQLVDTEVKHFHREAQTIAALLHPHIVRVLDFDVQDGVPFLVMDYVPNGTLRQRHPRGTYLPLPTILPYVKQVALALQYAHDHQVIHRDVKPENMLLGRNHEVLLSDFGIALLAQSSRSLSTQEVAGTATYMAPEQFQGKPRRASDQYALGVVVYEWLSGVLPFHGSFSEMASQHLFVLPASLRAQVPGLPAAVEEVVLMALAKDPQQRFASIQAFATALEQACQAAPSHQGVLPSETSPSSERVTGVLPTQLSQSTNVGTPPSQSLQSNVTATPPYGFRVPPPSRGELVSSGRSPSPKYHLSQRIVLWVLAALLILGGGLTWLTLSLHSSGSTVDRALTATSSISTAVARRANALTATSSTAFTATATSSPTPPVIVAQPTLTTDCGHLVTPWVALYQYSNYGGRELCFEGRGLINLADFGFDKETEAINIAANGVFFDQPNGKGAQIGFYYGDEKADLGSWDNRISSFRVDG